MVDELPANVTLAVNVQASKGVFAALLGSGLSRSAKIPTGWAIVQDLIARLAVASTRGSVEDPIGWYTTTYQKEPNYSEILDLLTSDPASRMQLLKSYFEPTPEEHQRGEKQATLAHKSLAKLVADGYIKVIVTTNFDRLMEQAVQAEGISPVVISSAEGIKRSPPLQHNKCTIIKIHGDYLDTKLKNTEEELSRYEADWKPLLKRIFREYGLIVCGWSAQWDHALREIVKLPGLYSTYWAARGSLVTEASNIVISRKGKVIPITDADAFLDELAMNVKAIESVFASSRALTVDLACERVKEFLADPTAAIRLHDLMMRQMDLCCSKLAALGDGSADNGEHAKQIEDAVEIPVAMMIQCCYWGEQKELLVKCFKKLLQAINRTEEPPNLFRYPAIIAFYGCMLAAWSRRNFEKSGWIMNLSGSSSSVSLTHLLSKSMKQLQSGLMNRLGRYMLSNHMYKHLYPHLKDFIATEAEYEQCFDDVEYLIGIGSIDSSTPPLALIGRSKQLGRFDAVHKRFEQFDHEGKRPPHMQHIFGSVPKFNDARIKYFNYVDKDEFGQG